MNILLWIVLGALAGWLAGIVLGHERRNWLANLVLGILGAGLGGAIATALGFGGITGFNLYSLLLAVAGACLLLIIYYVIRRYL